MKYFLDTEFIEGTRKTLIKSKPTNNLNARMNAEYTENTHITYTQC